MSTETTEEPNQIGAHDAEYLRRVIRVELLDARTGVGMTQKVMAEKLGWSISKVVRLEQGTVSVAPSDVRAIMSLFGADEARITQLVDLALEAREAKSWSDYDDVLTASYKDLIGQERSAQSITKYEPNVVPGLFQTEQYAVALSDALRIKAKDAARIVEVRLRRQAILESAACPEMNVVVGEVSLARPVGSKQIMKEQIDHLIELSGRPQINLFVMPFSAGAHVGMGVPFTILQFADERLDNVVYLEDARKRTTSSEDAELTREYFRRFSEIEQVAEASGSFEEIARRVVDERYT